jgi:hypothetical protein
MWRTCRLYLPLLQQEVLQVPYGTSLYGAEQRLEVKIHVSGLLEEKTGGSESKHGKCENISGKKILLWILSHIRGEKERT